jgi:hypothetical protein
MNDIFLAQILNPWKSRCLVAASLPCPKGNLKRYFPKLSPKGASKEMKALNKEKSGKQ